MLLSVLLFFLGVLSLQKCVELPSLWFLFTCVLVAFLLLYFRVRRIAFFLLGFVWAGGGSSYYLSHSFDPDLQAKELLVQGDIVGLPE